MPVEEALDAPLSNESQNEQIAGPMATLAGSGRLADARPKRVGGPPSRLKDYVMVTERTDV